MPQKAAELLFQCLKFFCGAAIAHYAVATCNKFSCGRFAYIGGCAGNNSDARIVIGRNFSIDIKDAMWAMLAHGEPDGHYQVSC